jgi:PPM family protein phosphatase
MILVSAGATDPGKKRANNEDSFLVHDAAGLYVVADGVGGLEGGEVASRIAVETLASIVPPIRDAKPSEGDALTDSGVSAALIQAVDRANRAIRAEQSRRTELADMGTTVSAVFFAGDRAYLIHVGDSRVYLLRSNELRQLSADHTLVAEHIRTGILTPAEARTSSYRHVITRALGTRDGIAPDITSQTIRKGDVFLLCTDGLTDMVSDRELAGILASNAPREAVQELITTANLHGGADNITAVVVQVREL